MHRLLSLFLIFGMLISCSKNGIVSQPPDVIPGIINGEITEINVTPIDINTPDKGTFNISANNTNYKVDFDAVAESQSNATIMFASDTILTDDSREFASLGKDAIAYNPVADNEIVVFFTDGRRVTGSLNVNTAFGGVFGEALIGQWRTSGEPAKPNQKAKDDIINLVSRYADKDGPGPGTAPQFLFAKVSRR